MDIKRYTISGEVPIGEGFMYVQRPVDQEFRRLVDASNRSQTTVLYGCRQAGKTTLAIRLAQVMKSAGRTIYIDMRNMQPHGSRELHEKDFMFSLCMSIATAEGRSEEFLKWRAEAIQSGRPEVESTSVTFKRFLRDVVLEHETSTVTIFLDEFDRVKIFGRTWEFLLDATYDVANQAIFSQLRFVCIGLDRPVDLAQRGDTAKYQHFVHLRVPDFDMDDPDVITGFAEGLHHIDTDVARREIAGVVLQNTGGQPFLTNYILLRIVQDRIDDVRGARESIKRLVDTWRFDKNRLPGDRLVHFDQPEKILDENPDAALAVLDAYQSVLSKRPLYIARSSVRNILLGSGLAVEDHLHFKVRSPIYQRVFDQEWIRMIRAILIRAHGDGNTNRLARPMRGSLPRVLLLNAGGTLGMDVDPDGRIVPPESAAALFNKIHYLDEVIDPIVETPIPRPTDGTNIVPSNWSAIAQTIHDFRGEDIAGALVVAGSDTLAYMASAVAFALGRRLPFPVVFTGAQAPITVRHGDAQVNMLRAALVARMGSALPEVVIVFNDTVLRAVRADKVDDFRFQAFGAPSQGPLAIIGEDLRFQLPIRESHGRFLEEWRLAADFEEHVLKLSLYPGFDPSFLEPVLRLGNVRGLLIESLGLGNVPVVEGYSLIPAIEIARELGVPVLISGRYPIRPESIRFYQPASRPLEFGAISAGDMAPPAALTKFMWAIAQIDAAIARHDISPNRRLDEIRQIMETNLLGEITPWGDDKRRGSLDGQYLV